MCGNLADWQQLQAQIWEIEAEEKHVIHATQAAQQRLNKLQSYRGRLLLARRQVARAGRGPFVGLSVSGLVELEEAVGHESARTWSMFLEALGRHSGGIPGLARALGEDSYELIASFAAVLVEVPPTFGFQSDSATLEQIIDSELLLGALDVVTTVDGSLAGKSFLTALLDSLTLNDPACISWAQAVLHREPMVNETVEGFLQHSTKSRQTPEVGTSLTRVVSMLTSSFCNHAAVAPRGLCHLAAALQAELAKNVQGSLREVQNALLGEIIIGRWLLPCIEPHTKQGQIAFAALTRTMTAVCSNKPESASCDKFAVAAGREKTSKSNAAVVPVPSLLSEVSPDFIRKEAQRLSTGFFDILIARGQKLKDGDAETPVWPRCMVWTVGDVVSLARLLDSSAAEHQSVRDAARSAGITDDVREALGKLEALTEVTVPVVCWLPKKGEHELLSFHSRARSISDDIPSSFHSRNSRNRNLSCGSYNSSKRPSVKEVELRHTGSYQQSFGHAESFGHAASYATSAPSWNPTQFRRQISVASSHHSEQENEKDVAAWEGLLWRVLADPWPLEGLPGGTLLGALQALLRVHQSDPSQLRLEALLGWLEPHKDPRMQVLLSSETESIQSKDSNLFDSFRQKVKKRQEGSTKKYKGMLQMRVAESLLSQTCSNSLRMLQDHASFRTQLLCCDGLQLLFEDSKRQKSFAEGKDAEKTRSATPHKKGESGDGTLANRGGLHLCIVRIPPGISANLVASLDFKGSGRGSKSFTGGSFMGSSRKDSSFNPFDPQTSGVEAAALQRSHIYQVFETHQCPIHQAVDKGVDIGNVKHDVARGWLEVVQAFKKLPLNEVLLGEEDSLGIAAAVQMLVELLSTRLFATCKQFDPPASARKAQDLPGELGGTVDVEEGAWPEPSEVLQADAKCVRQNAVRYVYDFIHPKLFPSKPTQADLDLSQCISKLSWLEPRHLDIPEVFLEMPIVDQSKGLLRGLSTHQDPIAMLDRLTQCFRNLTESACVLAQAGLVSGGDDGVLGADAALPLFILVLIRANPTQLESVLRYIELFTPRSEMLTEAGYAVVQARAATSFAMNVKPGSLAGLKKGEWMDCMGTQEHYNVTSFLNNSM